MTPEKQLAYLALVPLAWEEAFRATGEDGAPDTLLHHIGTQQDVSECLDNMIFQIEAALAAHPDRAWADGAAHTLRGLFFGRTAQRLGAAAARDAHVKEETFQTIPVTLLPEATSVYDALDTFFDDEELVGEDGARMHRAVSLLEAPPLLQLQVQRVQYDRTRGRAVKNQAEVALEPTLFLDRYLDLGAAPSADDRARHDAARADRARLAELRARLAACTGEDQALPTQLDTLQQTLAHVRGTPALDALLAPARLARLGAAAHALRADADEARAALHATRDALHARWDGAQRVAYELAAVFMHRGTCAH